MTQDDPIALTTLLCFIGAFSSHILCGGEEALRHIVVYVCYSAKSMYAYVCWNGEAYISNTYTIM